MRLAQLDFEGLTALLNAPAAPKGVLILIKDELRALGFERGVRMQLVLRNELCASRQRWRFQQIQGRIVISEQGEHAVRSLLENAAILAGPCGKLCSQICVLWWEVVTKDDQVAGPNREQRSSCSFVGKAVEDSSRKL